MLNQSKSNVKEQLTSRPRLKPTFNLVTTKEEEIRLKDKRKVCCVCGTLHEIKYVIPLRSEIAVEQKSMICLNILSDTTNIMYPEMTKQNNIEAFVCLRCVVDAKDAYIFRRKCMNSLMKTAEKYRFPFKTFIRSDSKKKFVNASTQTEGYKPHQCGMCDVIYGSYEELKSHMIERHPPTTSQGASEARRTSREKLNTRPNHILLHHENSYQSLNDTVDERKQNEIRDLAIQSVDSDNEMQKSLGTSFEESIIYEEEEFDESNPFHLDETIEFDEHDFENEEQVQQIFIEADEIDYSLIEYEHIPEIFEDDTKYEEPEMTGDISEELDSDKLAKAIESDNNEDAMSEISEKKSSDEELSSIEQLTPKPKTNNKCTLCERMFTRSAHLARHMKCHNNVRDHKCTECDKSFTRPDHLALHMHNHSKTKPFQCDKCNKQFTRAERYRFHLANKLCGTPKPSINYCDICHKSFSSTHYLRIHMDNHTATTFPCKVCDMKLTNRSAYHQHMRTHTKREYLCPECGATFRRADYLSMHLRRHSGVKPFKCRYCDKSFPRNTEMKMHERYHTGEKTQMCTICGKKFHRACNLKVHMRVHTGEKPYQCTHCDRTFSQSNDLKTHIRRHTGERFKCDLCAETFLFSHYLSRHKRDVHNVEVPVVNSRVEKFEVCNSEDECDEEVDEDECKMVLCEGSDDPLDVSNMIAAVDIRNLDVQIEALL